MKVVKSRCGGKKGGCSLKITKGNIYEFPYYIQDKAA
jgi:hypothetical protein